jgi:hypothetical protein
VSNAVFGKLPWEKEEEEEEVSRVVSDKTGDPGGLTIFTAMTLL